jgi:UDP-N-acetylglucosamine 2-epimerase (non-hydrolysing)
MLKVMTIIGTRPEIIKLSRVIAELDRCMTHVLVHTGQNYDYELNEIFFNEMEIRKPDHFLDAVGETTAETIGNIIARSDHVMQKEAPDAVLLYGDTNSCLSVIAAKRRKIPVFHMEAGNRCFDQRVPEEINRKIVDHLSDINMPLTEHARQYLVAEGLPRECIIKSGSCMKEVLEYNREKIEASKVLEKMGLKSGGYFVLSAHREENVDSETNFKLFVEAINLAARTYSLPIIFSVHPRTLKRIESLPPGTIDPLIRTMKPLGYFDYVKLQMKAFCIISDSGTITEEASLLSLPAVTIREAHERPEGMDVGTLIMSGLKPGRVIEAIEIVTRQAAGKTRVFKVIPDYEVENVSQKVVRIIQSYVDYVNRTVWRKS